MASKFPGMDPFIEGQQWDDFHTRFIVTVANELSSALAPKYLTFVEKRVYLELFEEEIRTSVRPDISILKEKASQEYPGGGGIITPVEPVTLLLPAPEQMEEPYIEIRTSENREVIAVIELLSPANKRPRSEGRREYLRKREAILHSDAHLIEMDLLRGGERLPMGQKLPPADYFIIVSRAPSRPLADVYAFTLHQRLPVLRIPLAADDPDFELDLQAVFDTVYEQANYRYALDYAQLPNPPLDEQDASWIQDVLKEAE